MPDNLMPSQPGFPTARRGYVPEVVDDHIRDLHRAFEDREAAIRAEYAGTQIELDEARKREEAVHLTFVAATKTKEELLVNAQHEAEEIVASSQQQSDQLRGEAKKEAFRLVSEARQAAEETTNLAKQEAANAGAKAQTTADATRDAARREALQMINSVERDIEKLQAAQDEAMAEMRAQYQHEEAELAARVSKLRATATDLEARLKAIATATLGDAAGLLADLPTERDLAPAADSAPAPEVHQKARTAIRRDLADAPLSGAASESTNEPRSQQLDDAVGERSPNRSPYSPAEMASQLPDPAIKDLDAVPAHADQDRANEAVAATQGIAEPAAEGTTDDQPVDEEPAVVATPASKTDESEPMARKGSYYARRSANLPRIGQDAGRNALAIAKAVRGASKTRGDDEAPAQTA